VSTTHRLRRAAEQGDASAQRNLGYMYSKGRGAPQSDTKAVEWYRLAAEQGYPNAQASLGYMHINGRGVPQSDTEAVKWWRLAAEQGDADAQFNFGTMHSKGRGVPRDSNRAAAFFLVSGDADAQAQVESLTRPGVLFDATCPTKCLRGAIKLAAAFKA
jgi:TPR repeat protein